MTHENHSMLSVSHVVIEHLGKRYSVDFDIEFELINPKDSIYSPDGYSVVDRGQDEVNFTVVWPKVVIELSSRKNINFLEIDDVDAFCEALIDYCTFTPEMHMEAFKHFKGHK